MPSAGNRFQVTVAPLNRSGSSLSDSVRLRPPTPASSSNEWVRVFHSRQSGYETDPRSTPLPGRVVYTATSRAGSRNGSGRISTVSTTLNIVLLTPMPSARQTTVRAAKPGLLTSVRSA